MSAQTGGALALVHPIPTGTGAKDTKKRGTTSRLPDTNEAVVIIGARIGPPVAPMVTREPGNRHPVVSWIWRAVNFYL